MRTGKVGRPEGRGRKVGRTEGRRGRGKVQESVRSEGWQAGRGRGIHGGWTGRGRLMSW